MAKYIIKRILYMIPVLSAVAFLVFTILSLTPGDPGTIILGITAKPEDVAALNAQFGYDKSFLIRFFSYIGNIIFHFDLGTSYASRQPVINDILARFPNTFILALLSMCVSSIIGISLGILSAVRPVFHHRPCMRSCCAGFCIHAWILAWTDAADRIFLKAWMVPIIRSCFVETFYSADTDGFADLGSRTSTTGPDQPCWKPSVRNISAQPRQKVLPANV